MYLMVFSRRGNDNVFDGIYTSVGSSDDFIEDCECSLNGLISFSATQMGVKVADVSPVETPVQPECQLL